MHCKNIRNLLGDYIDGELNEPLREEVKQHLNICSRCKSLEEDLRHCVIEPLNKAERIGVPEEIWPRIRNNIETQHQRAPLPHIMKRLFAPARVLKPAFAIVTVLVVFLSAIMFIRGLFDGNRDINPYLEEQASFLFHLTNGEKTDYSNMDDINLGTAIEEYLL